MVVLGRDKLQGIERSDQKHLKNSGSWQLTWNDEGLGQSTLTKAHGDYAGGKISP